MGRINAYLESCHRSLGQVAMACFLTLTLAVPSNFAPILAEGNIDNEVDVPTAVDTEPNVEAVVEDTAEVVATTEEGPETEEVAPQAETQGLAVSAEWIESSFNMTDVSVVEGKDVLWESDKATQKRFTMRINYSDAQCTNGYDAGALEIRVPLMAELTDDLIFADSNLAYPTHDFNYRYSNAAEDGSRELILRNNHAIPAGNNFTGTIQVIWQINNRGNSRSWEICPVSVAKDKAGNTYENRGEETLSLSITNTKDVFSPSFTTSKMTDIANMEDGWRDYIWVQYKFTPGQDKKTLPLSDGSYVFDIPSDCVVYNDGVLSPSTAAPSKYFKKISRPNEPEAVTFSVGWPKAQYDGKVATMTGSMTGTYMDGTKLNESDATFTWSTNLSAADYDFTYEGERFAITQYAEYDETDTGILDGTRDDIEKSLHFHVNAWGKNYPGEKYTYEITTDWIDITTNRNGYRGLEGSEIRDITIYAPRGILDASGNARPDQNSLVGKVYAYNVAGEETFVGELKGISVGYDTYVTLPKGSVYGKVVYEDVDGYVNFDSFDILYMTRVSGFDYNGTGLDADMSPLTGKVRHNAGLIVTDAQGAWANQVGPESYTGSQNDMLYARDMERYGHAVQRAYGEMRYHEYRKSIVSYKQNLELKTSNAPSTGSDYIRQQMMIRWTASGSWSGDDTSVHPTYTSLTFMAELPKGWVYSPNQNWTTIMSGKYPVKTTVMNNWRNKGKTMVRWDIDTSSDPLQSWPNFDSWSACFFYFNMEIPLDLYYEYGRNYTINAWSWVNGEETNAIQISGTGTTTDASDRNDNNVRDEIIGAAKADISLAAALGSHLEANEKVSAESTNGTWDSSATVGYGEEYSYKLGFMTGSTVVTDLVMYDTIEEGSDWKGTLVDVDTSYMTKAGYHPVVYLTEDVNAPNDVTNETWKLMDAFVAEKPLASAVRVAVALEGDTVPGSSYVRCLLKMKASEDEADVAGTARDFYTVHFTNKEGTAMTLPSGEVSVMLAEDYGQITIVKRDATDESLLSGVRFNVVNGSGAVILENVAPATYDLPVGTYNVVEVVTPMGYVEPDMAFGPVSVLVGENTKVDISNTRKTGSIRIIKNDATSGAPMEGVTFTASLNGEVVAEATTDASGVALFTDLVWGNYTINEKDTPAGYEPMEPATVSVTRTNADPLKPIEQRVTNQRKTGVAEIHKVDSTTNKPLSGASFGLYEVGSNKAIKSAITNSMGEATFTGIIWGKSYYVKETSAPKGYELNTTTYPVELLQDSYDQRVVIDCQNTQKLGNIIIAKTDSVTKKPLSGATFDIVQNGKVIRTGIVTNALGNARVSNLPWGTYILRETAAPLGYANLASDEIFTINASNAGYVLEIDVTNTRTHGDLKLVKYDIAQGTDTTLAGASFTIRNTETKESFAVVTSEGGPSVITNVPYGDYEITEIEAPEGYKKLDEPISFKFSQTNDTCFIANELWTDNRLIVPIAKYGATTDGSDRVELNAADAEWSGNINMTLNSFNLPEQKPDTSFEVENGQLVFQHEKGSGNVIIGQWPFGWYHSNGSTDYMGWCPSVQITETKAPVGYANTSGESATVKSFKISLFTAYQGTDNTNLKYQSYGGSIDNRYVDEVGLKIFDDDSPQGRVLVSIPITPMTLTKSPTQYISGFDSPTVAQIYFANHASTVWDLLSWSARPITTEAATVVDDPLPTVKFTIKKQGVDKDGTITELDPTLLEWTQYTLSDDGASAIPYGDSFAGAEQVRSLSSDTFAPITAVDNGGWWSVSPYNRAIMSVGETKALEGYSNQMIKGKPGVVDYTGFHIAVEAYYIYNGKRYNYSVSVPRSGTGTPISEIGFRIWDATSPSGRYVKAVSFDSNKNVYGNGVNSVSQLLLNKPSWWPASIDLGEITVNNEKLDYGLSVQKVDSDTKEPLEGASFTIDFVKRSALGIETRSPNVWDDITNKDGYFETLSHYPYKFLDFLQTYWPEDVGGDLSGCWTYLEIRETNPPAGYKTPELVKFGDEVGAPGVVARLTYNYDINCEGKTEAEKQAIAASLNAPYLDQSAWNKLVVENTKPITTIKFQKIDGTTKEPMANVQFAVEKRNADNTWQTVDTVTTNEQGEFIYSTKVLGEYRVVEQAMVGYMPLEPMYVSISEENSGSTISLGDNGVVTNNRKTSTVTIYKIDKDSGDPIPGAVFDLYDRNGTIVATDVVTDGQGQAVISNVSISLTDDEKYYLVESSVPDGYMLDIDCFEYVRALNKWAIPVLITSDNETIVATNDADAELGEVVIQKQDATTGDLLAGAVFGLYNAAGDLVVTSPATDNTGFVKFYAPTGTYTVRELVAPEGYVCSDDEWTIDVLSVMSMTIEDSRAPGKVIVQKVDSATGQVLSGASFVLLSQDTTGAFVEVDRQTTNDSGIAIFDSIAWDVAYCVKEVEAPQGYAVSDREESVQLVSGETDLADREFVFDWDNDRLLGTVCLTKTDTLYPELAVQGAIYQLVNTDTNETVREDLVTDADGQIIVDGLEWGNYAFVEISAPHDYICDQTPIAFAVNAENVNNTIAVFATNNKNEPVDASRSISITKRFVSNYRAEDETITAVFECVGSDDTRQVQTVSFSSSETEKVCTFRDLSAEVSYTVREIGVLRYEGTIVETNGTIIDDGAAAQFGAVADKGVVVIENTSISDKDLTGRNAVRNVVSSDGGTTAERILRTITARWIGETIGSDGTLNVDLANFEVLAKYTDGSTMPVTAENLRLDLDLKENQTYNSTVRSTLYVTVDDVEYSIALDLPVEWDAEAYKDKAWAAVYTSGGTSAVVLGSTSDIPETYEGMPLSKVYGSEYLDYVNSSANYQPIWYDANSVSPKTVCILDPLYPTSIAGWFRNVEYIKGLENLYTDDVTTMTSAFYGFGGRTLDISHWVVNNVKDTRSMFAWATSLTTIYASRHTSFTHVSSTMSASMFDQCQNLQGGCGSKVYGGTTSTVITAARARVDSIGTPGYFTGPLALTDAVVYSADDNSLTFYNRDVEVKLGDVYEGKTITWLANGVSSYYSSYSLRPWYAWSSVVTSVKFADDTKFSSVEELFRNFSKLKTIEGFEHIDFSKYSSFYYMFSGCYALESVDVSTWDVSSLRETESMFYSCSSLRYIYAAADTNWRTQAHLSTSMSKNMFNGCYALIGSDGFAYNGSKVNYLYAQVDGLNNSTGYFYHRTPKTLLDAVVYSSTDSSLRFYDRDVDVAVGDTYEGRVVTKIWNNIDWTSITSANTVPWKDYTSAKIVSFEDLVSVESTAYWFNGLSNLTTIEKWENLDTTNITSMTYMFASSGIRDFDMSVFNDLSHVQDMSYMFNSANLRTWRVGSANMESVANTSCMFSGANLTEVSIEGWSGQSITNASSMFSANTSLTKIICDEGADWRNIPTSSYMFYNCSKLVGGNGYAYDYYSTNAKYAVQDGWNGAQGYFNHPMVCDLTDGAVIYSATDKSLRFYNRDETVTQGELFDGRISTYIYPTGWAAEYDRYTKVPWYSLRNVIESVEIVDEISPTSLDYWFYNCSKLTSLDLRNVVVDGVTSTSQSFHMTGIKEIWFNCGLPLTTYSDLSGDVWWDDNFESHAGSDLYEWLGTLTTLTEVHLRQDLEWVEDAPVTHSYAAWYNDGALVFGEGAFIDPYHDGSSMSGYVRGVSNIHLKGSAPWRSSIIKLVVWPESFAPTDTSWWFGDYTLDTNTPFDVSDWNMSNVTKAQGMFAGTNVSALYADDDVDWSFIADSAGMFERAYNLSGSNGFAYDSTKVTAEYAHVDGVNGKEGYFSSKTQSLKNAAVYSADDNALRFYNRDDVVTIGDQYEGHTVSAVLLNVDSSGRTWSSYSPSTIIFEDMIKPITIESWFTNISNVQGWENLDTSICENMTQAFYDTQLTEADVCNFNMSSVIACERMFSNTYSLRTIYAKAETDWSVLGLTSNSMFEYSSSITGMLGSNIHTNGDRSIAMARIDGGANSPGLFTDPEAVIADYTVRKHRGTVYNGTFSENEVTSETLRDLAGNLVSVEPEGYIVGDMNNDYSSAEYFSYVDQVGDKQSSRTGVVVEDGSLVLDLYYVKSNYGQSPYEGYVVADRIYKDPVCKVAGIGWEKSWNSSASADGWHPTNIYDGNALRFRFDKETATQIKIPYVFYGPDSSVTLDVEFWKYDNGSWVSVGTQSIAGRDLEYMASNSVATFDLPEESGSYCIDVCWNGQKRYYSYSSIISEKFKLV